MLFILVMEVLSNMMDRPVSGGLFKGFDAVIRGHSNVTVTHSLFADDMLVFCDADVFRLAHLRLLLFDSRLCQALRSTSENVRSHRWK